MAVTRQPNSQAEEVLRRAATRAARPRRCRVVSERREQRLDIRRCLRAEYAVPVTRAFRQLRARRLEQELSTVDGARGEHHGPTGDAPSRTGPSVAAVDSDHSPVGVGPLQARPPCRTVRRA